MYRQLKKQANVRGVANSAIATAEIPTTGTHYALLLRFLDSSGDEVSVANIKSEITNVVIRINGDQIIEATPTFLFALQKYYGDPNNADNVAGILPIFFARPGEVFSLFAQRALYALGMANVNSFTVDITCGTLTNVASIEVYSHLSTEVRNLGQHIRITKFPQSHATTGLQEVMSLPKEGNDVGYLALHTEHGDGLIDKATVKIGGNDVYDEVPSSIAQCLQESAQRNPQSGYTHIPFDLSNTPEGFIPMAGVQDFRVQYTWNTVSGAPGNYNIYAERIFGLKTKSA